MSKQKPFETLPVDLDSLKEFLQEAEAILTEVNSDVYQIEYLLHQIGVRPYLESNKEKLRPLIKKYGLQDGEPFMDVAEELFKFLRHAKEYATLRSMTYETAPLKIRAKFDTLSEAGPESTWDEYHERLLQARHGALQKKFEHKIFNF